MRVLVVSFMILACTAAYAIPSADAYIPWDNSDGTSGPLSKTNPAWDNVGTSGIEDVHYIGPGSAPATPVAEVSGGVKGGYANISDYGDVTTDKFQTHNYYSTSGIVGDVMSGASALTVSFWIRDDFARQTSSYPNQYVFHQQGVPTTALKYRGDQNRMQFMWNNQSGWLYGSWDTVKSDNNEWIFFAITVDTVSDTITMYSGDENNAAVATNTFTGLSLDPLATLAGDTSAHSHTLWGWTFNGTDPYPGFDMDEYRIYSQALGAQDIEAIRQFDLVPEPATLLLVGLGGLVLRKRS